MRIPIYQVDAFTERPFGGNPAAVCPLEHWLADETLQAIAAENNLSETAFFVPRGEDFELRWFTPTVEVDLCGHATLAAGKVILDRLRSGADSVRFHTKSGELAVKRRGELFELDFPSQPGEPFACATLVEAMGGTPIELFRSVHYDLLAYASEADVRALEPSEAGLLAHDKLGVIATAPGLEVDFVSRFFAPRAGVFEDPVTGSAHCVLTPYWARRLGKNELRARQISHRVGELTCTQDGERVRIAGGAVLYLEGEITLT